MRRTLLLLPLAAGLLHCGSSAVKPKPGATAGTSAGNGSSSTGASGSSGSHGSTSGSTSSATSTGTTSSGTSAGSTSAGTSSGTTSTSTTTGTTSAGTSAGSTSAGTSAGSTSAGTSAGSTSAGTSAGTTSAGTSAGTTSAGTSAGTTSGTSTSGTTGGTTGSSDGFVRFADFVPTPGSFDFCLTPSGGAPIGPIIASYAAGGISGLAFPDVSLYIAIPGSTGGTTYAVSVVTAGSSSCTPPLLAPPGATVNVVTGVYSTALVTGLVGSATMPITFAQFDDRLPGTGPEAHVRFIHAAPDATHPAVNFGRDVGGTITDLFFNVTYGSSSIGQPGTGPRGYLAVAPSSDSYVVRDHSGPPNRPVLANVGPITLAGGDASTFFFIGDSSSPSRGLQLLSCPDDGALAVQNTAVLNNNCQ